MTINMHNSFLQSELWEKFQRSVGYKTWRIDDVLLIKKPLFFGCSYFYAPRKTQNAKRKTQFFDSVKELAKKEKCIFLRIEPIEELKIENCKLKITRSADVQPSQTIILDLSLSEDELLAQMHPKTRYNIRLAEKKSVTIRKAAADELEKFWQLMKETTDRDEFRAHSKEYYKEMLQIDCHSERSGLAESERERSEESIIDPSLLSVAQDDKNKFGVKLYFAEYENKILAAGIFVFYGDIVTYLHGASTHQHKELMAPHALHWHMIKFAKQLEYAQYDFYGINEAKWPGVTRFKRGFGGQEVNYPGCYDVIFSAGWYGIYKFMHYLRGLI